MQLEWWKNFIKAKVMDWVEHRQTKLSSTRIGKDLSALNPGKIDSLVLIRYISGKLYLISIVFIIGMLFVGIVLMKGNQNIWITDEGKIERNKNGSSSSSCILNAEINDIYLDQIPIELEAKELTVAEIEERMNQLEKELPNYIKGENRNLQEVRTDLELINKDPFSNIEISWESSNRELLTEEGIIAETVSEKGETVSLKASMYYKNYENEIYYEITILPKIRNSEEFLLENIEKLVKEKEESSRENAYFELPKEINGEKIHWSEDKKPVVFIMIILLVVTMLSLYYGMDQDLHKKYLKRNTEMLLAYGKFISQLELLISSGMSVRACLIKLGKDYKKRKERSGKEEYCYEELLISIKMLENGSSEQEALENFAKRSGLMSYKKVVSILCQNMKRGNDGLRIKLKEEIRNAFEERKMLARRMGEEAETKLLLPMMMMLGIVFIMILLPAFLSFGGI